MDHGVAVRVAEQVPDAPGGLTGDARDLLGGVTDQAARHLEQDDSEPQQRQHADPRQERSDKELAPYAAREPGAATSPEAVHRRAELDGTYSGQRAEVHCSCRVRKPVCFKNVSDSLGRIAQVADAAHHAQ